MTSTSAEATLGIVGYGAFGRLTARHLSRHFDVLAHDPAFPEGVDPETGARLATLAEVSACRFVVLAVPVSEIGAVSASISGHLRPGATVLDVGSVKVAAVSAMLANLPAHVDVVATHPLFGPQSAKGGLRGLKVAVCPVRGDGAPRVAAFLRRAYGLDVVIATPERHDREAAMVQGLTHLIAKVLVEMEPLPTRMTTRSFERLMEAVGMVRHDSAAVFDAIETMNPYAGEVRRRFFSLAAKLDADLAAAHDGSGTPARVRRVAG